MYNQRVCLRIHFDVSILAGIQIIYTKYHKNHFFYVLLHSLNPIMNEL